MGTDSERIATSCRDKNMSLNSSASESDRSEASDEGRALSGRTVLVVEDSVLVAMDILETLTEAGGTVIGPASNLKTSERLVEDNQQIDGAVLDVNLNGEMVYPLARKLRERGIPFTFLTGYDDNVLPNEFENCPRLVKPVKKDALLSQIRTLFN